VRRQLHWVCADHLAQDRRRAVEGGGTLGVTLGAKRRDLLEAGGDPGPVVRLELERQPLLEEDLRLAGIAAAKRRGAEADERAGDAPEIAELALRRERLFEHARGAGVVVLRERDGAERGQAASDVSEVARLSRRAHALLEAAPCRVECAFHVQELTACEER
jgi:hypothetical protein